MMSTKQRTLVAVLILSAAAIVILAVHRHLRGYEQQIDNLELAKACGRALDDYHQEHHMYPTSLPAAYSHLARETNASPGRDAWGHPWFYQSKGIQFILVSFGRDGRPESKDYWQYRMRTTPTKICGNPNADQVMSELGFHQACGK